MRHSLDHFRYVMTKYGSTYGHCFQRSFALMLDLRGATLVLGEFPAASEEDRARDPNASPVPFIHAWVEIGDMAYVPTLYEKFGNRLVSIPCDVYRGANGCKRAWTLSERQFRALARGHRLSSGLRQGRPDAGSGDFVEAVLKAAGVPYAVTPHRTIIIKQD